MQFAGIVARWPISRPNVTSEASTELGFMFLNNKLPHSLNSTLAERPHGA